MPFTDVSELPPRIRRELTEKEQEQFMTIFNEVHAETGDESIALATALDAVTKVDWSVDVAIGKLDEDKMLAFGWLSVAVDKDGATIVDKQGDMISPEELEKTAYDFVLFARRAGEMHKKIGVGRLVESMMFTTEKIAALGLPEGALPLGWWVGFKVDDPVTWDRIKSGQYSAFSIGGRAIREEVKDGA